MTQEIMTELKHIRTDIANLRDEVTAYKGFMHGLLWAGSIVVGLGASLLSWFKTHGGS